MTDYAFSIEHVGQTLPEMLPLYTRHYAEMADRLAKDGIEVSPFNPRTDLYIAACERGDLIHYVVRVDGKAVGYSNIYLTNDMHNRDLIAREDTIYIVPEHRNGIGRKLSRLILSDLKQRGVKRINVSAMTDLRVAKLWERMGFKHTAHQMTYIF